MLSEKYCLVMGQTQALWPQIGGSYNEYISTVKYVVFNKVKSSLDNSKACVFLQRQYQHINSEFSLGKLTLADKTSRRCQMRLRVGYEDEWGLVLSSLVHGSSSEFFELKVQNASFDIFGILTLFSRICVFLRDKREIW